MTMDISIRVGFFWGRFLLAGDGSNGFASRFRLQEGSFRRSAGPHPLSG
jgi:hypothetical protein